MSIKSVNNKAKPVNYRSVILKCLNKIIIDNAYTDTAIQEQIHNNNKLDELDIPKINETVYEIIRHKNKVDYIWTKYVKNQIKKEEFKNLLRIGTYELIFLDGGKEHASIYEIVSLAKKLFGSRIGNFINAVLRNIQRNKKPLIEYENELEDIEIKYSFPNWIINYWNNRFDLEKIENLCSALNTVPNLILRTNTLKIKREQLLEKLISNNIEAEKTSYSPSGIRLLDRINPVRIPGYDQGFFTVQDEAAQLISIMLQPGEREKILDACSAPGGKSTHIAELMNDSGEIISIDSNKKRLSLVNFHASRLSLESIKTLNLDLTDRKELENFTNYFDKILLDAPCSGLGTIRRNPDLKWNRKESQISELSDLQLELLKNLSPTLKCGGLLLYSVCTISELENELVIEKFLRENSNFEIVKIFYPEYLKKFIIDDNFFISYPDKFDMDGFFAVILKKIKD